MHPETNQFPIQDEISQAMERLGVTPLSPIEIDGLETSKPAQQLTSITLLRHSYDTAWRSKVIKLDESHHPKVEELSKWIERFIKGASINTESKPMQLVITGPPGVGKTHAAKRIKRWFDAWSIDLWYHKKWDHPPNAAFIDWASLCEKKNEDAFEDALNEINGSDIVILDDVGSESDRFKSGESTSRLRRALSRCEYKWLYVNANFAKPQWESKFDVRVADRLEAAHYMDMTGVPSFRQKLR